MEMGHAYLLNAVNAQSIAAMSSLRYYVAYVEKPWTDWSGWMMDPFVYARRKTSFLRRPARQAFVLARSVLT